MDQVNYAATICIRVSPRTKKMKKADDIRKNLIFKTLDMLEPLGPLLKKHKIDVMIV